MSLMDVLGGVGYALDTPGALLRGLLAGRPGKRVSGRELLGLTENKPGLDSGDVAGFIAETVLDPLNLIGGAAAGKLIKTLSKAKMARKAASTVSKTTSAANTAPSLYRAVTRPMKMAPGISHTEVAEHMRKGGDWVAKYFRTRPTVAGNVVNPRSGLPLWKDVGEGRAALNRVSNREIVVAPSRYYKNTDAYFYRAPGYPVDSQHIGFNNRRLRTQTPHEIRRIGAHEHTHAVTGLGNMHPLLASTLDRATKRGSRAFAEHLKKAPRVDHSRLQGAFDYITHPEEMYARIMELRNTLHRMPSQVRKTVLGKNNEPIRLSMRALTDLRDATGSDRMVRALLRIVPAVAGAAAIPASYYAHAQHRE